METQTVVVTGASAGIGRATARLFGERGARVGLIARGQAGLDGAARDVVEAGGIALPISADVADYDQVVAAARQIEERLGPIDVWVNVAFTSVFLLQPADGSKGHDYGPRGVFDDKSHDRSAQLWLAQHARVSFGFLAGAAVTGALVAVRLGRSGHRP